MPTATPGESAAAIGELLRNEASLLSFPRYPGTEGDARAVAEVRERFAAAGLAVATEPFSYDLRPAWWALRSVLVASGLLLAASGLVLGWRPWLALVLAVSALLPSAFFLAWAPWLERLYARDGETETANVVARRPSVGAPRMVLVLMAHHDSKSQSLTLPWRLGLTLVALAAALLQMVLLLQLVLGRVEGAPSGGLGPSWLGAVCGGVGSLAIFVLATIHNGNRSPGAVDNAGSLAILLHLARRLPARLPEDVELVFLSPGAEEDHMVGAMRFLDRHRLEDRECPVYTLNLDGGGNPGKLVLLERYGFGRAFSTRLSRVSREVAGRLGIGLRRVLLPPGMGIDAIPFAHRGLETMTYSSGSLGRATLAVHSAADRPELLDAPTLERVALLVEEVATALAGGGEDDAGVPAGIPV